MYTLTLTLVCNYCLYCVLLFYRVCVVCVAPAHSLLTENGIHITAINFNNLSCNVVSGKKKRVTTCRRLLMIYDIIHVNFCLQGGFLLDRQSVLCSITCDDGRVFKLRRFDCCVQCLLYRQKNTESSL